MPRNTTAQVRCARRIATLPGSLNFGQVLDTLRVAMQVAKLRPDCVAQRTLRRLSAIFPDAAEAAAEGVERSDARSGEAFRLPRSRVELEAPIEAAIAALDVSDGDPDLEPKCEDEGAACEDEGDDTDREPDLDADLRLEPAWMSGSRPASEVDGEEQEWRSIDLEDAPDTLAPPRAEWRMAD